MRVTVSHNKRPEEIRSNIDRSFDDIFKAIPIGPVQIENEVRTWNGSKMDFTFNARAGFLSIPIKGFVHIEEKQVTIDVDLPAFLNQFIPEAKVKTAIEGRVKGLLT